MIMTMFGMDVDRKRAKLSLYIRVVVSVLKRRFCVTRFITSLLCYWSQTNLCMVEPAKWKRAREVKRVVIHEHMIDETHNMHTAFSRPIISIQ